MDSHTQMFGVFGNPIAHSMSPAMMNRAFLETGINGAYAAFCIRGDQLKQAVEGIRALGFGGVNVTIPHKVNIMPYLDEVDEGARKIGAVNTVVNDGGRLVGYNTDGIGYVRSLKEETGINLEGKRILMIGAGGAARGVVYALALEGPERIWIANRTRERAEQLARYFSPLADMKAMGLDEIVSVKDDVDLIINTTSIGMHPHTGEIPIDPAWIREGIMVSDLVYNPLETLLLKEARARGAMTHGGLGMFIYQGAYAFEYWTNQAAPVQAMRDEVEKALGVKKS